ncbi:hypothetical protein HMPREF1870_01989 [Bacteroidales bacterium KA00344]|nr:hypothetical protein HMPREF1870_01989 [Bacteroidales bacterium KA00344]
MFFVTYKVSLFPTKVFIFKNYPIEFCNFVWNICHSTVGLLHKKCEVTTWIAMKLRQDRAFPAYG